MLELQGAGTPQRHLGPARAEEYLRAVEVGHDLGLRRDTRFGMTQRQWLIGRPGTGERKVGSRDIAKEPT